jgi:DNA-binding phage protein
LLRWFEKYNDGREYVNQVRPLNFLTVFPARRNQWSEWEVADDAAGNRRKVRDDLPRPVAPFNSNPIRAAENCFDRHTGASVSSNRLKTYAAALSDYHLHPEAKSLNGDYTDCGPTERRHVHVAGVRRIGKEANRWEEQFYLGYDPETQIEYGADQDGYEQFRARLCEAEKMHGQRKLAITAGVAREQLRAILKGEVQPRPKTIAKLLRAISLLAVQVQFQVDVDGVSSQIAEAVPMARRQRGGSG